MTSGVGIGDVSRGIWARLLPEHEAPLRAHLATQDHARIDDIEDSTVLD